MKATLKHIFLLVLLLPFACMAQQGQVKCLRCGWSVTNKQRTQTILFTQTLCQSAFQLQSVKYTLSKTAVFCRMEDAIYKRYNFLFKLRMGTDDYYSN